MLAGGDRLSIGDGEFLHRKIPVSTGWYDLAVSPKPSPEAFGPHRIRDITGISLDRAYSELHPQFRTPEQSATGKSVSGYYVAVLLVGDLRACGIEVNASPEPDNPGHVELPGLRGDNKQSREVQEAMQLLARKLTISVLGPFFPEI